MSFENLIKILGQTPLNSPSCISTLGEFRTKLSKIEYGDIFIGKKEEFDEAIKKGAFVIISDEIDSIIDDEVAWIEVESIEGVLKRILRFKLLNSNHQFYYFDNITFELLELIANKKELNILDQDLKVAFQKIVNAKQNSIFISHDERFLEEIYPDFENFSTKKAIAITKSSLFSVDFIFEEKVFEDVRISPLFERELSTTLAFLESKSIGYDLKKVSSFRHFNPTYITKDFKIKGFGESQYLLIVEQNPKLVNREAKLLSQDAKWASPILVIPKSLEIKKEPSIKYLHIDKLDEIFDIELSKFNFILIVANYNELYQTLLDRSNKRNPSLFEEL